MDELEGSRSSSPATSGHVREEHGGDYSTHMEELFGGDEGELEEEEEEFLYDGVDAEQVTGTNYREQLRSLLGPDDTSDVFEEEEVERSLLKEDSTENFGEAAPAEPFNHAQVALDPASLPQPLLTQTATAADTLPASPLPPREFSEPVLLPNVSRLRSFAYRSPQREADRGLPDVSAAVGFASPPSRVSDISRSSTPRTSKGPWKSYLKVDREVFRWTALQNASNHLFGKRPSKAAIVLGASNLGTPTVLAANGLICVGTDTGRVFVFDFKQTLLGICGNDTSASTVGAVSAVALSHDHTYVATGHVSGYIQIFDLKNPQVPARVVAPPSAQAIVSGRHEGHLAGSRIANVSFVAGRHTAIISADEHGLAFYHSLGKVLFVEASDTIRILGNYPQELRQAGSPSISVLNAPGTRSFRRRKPRNTLLAMATLPLGTVPHPTDVYQIIALLTSNKLVIVGLKPSPKTWLKRPRPDDAFLASSGRRRSALAWFPSINTPQGSKDDGSHRTHPTLAYSWGKSICLLRVSETMVKQSMHNQRTGKTREVDVGTLVFEDVGNWTMDDIVIALQWLNANQLLVFTTSTLSVYDARTSKLIEHVSFNASALMPASLGSTTDGSMTYSESLSDVAHSIRSYKGKIFLLCREELQVATMLTWADKILSLVEQGDFLSALELTRSYYIGEAPGNRNGLPDTTKEQQAVLGQKLHELMVSSASYAFSEDRMTDGTHSTPDGRGVDRTSLFEGLVTSCARCCITLDNYDFLFEDLFQYFEDAGITRIYLEQLETFVLEGIIDFVPPRITQRLVALYEGSGQPVLAERVIWHIDPSCLDINQAIHLCQTHQLWDALIYVYTRALRDYVAPIVELISLIRQSFRRSLVPNGAGVQHTASSPRHAYKIFPYLINVLNGQTYPSGEPLSLDEAEHAKHDVYDFIFKGTSTVWPSEGGQLILTGNGIEPTYPYTRLFLRFDAELFLHSLDIAFEDSFLTDSRDINRLSIVKVLLDIASCQDLPLSATVFINIFIARNIPKYPQYIPLEDLDSRVLYGILVSLATSPDSDTREDRQLAAEYLLSAYTPRDNAEIENLFEKAGFYRILQNRRRHERHWRQLLFSYLLDPSLQTPSLFPYVEEVLELSGTDNHGVLPEDIQSAFSGSLDQLLSLDLQATATLVDKFAPNLHESALNIMEPTDDRRRYDYLLHLVNLQMSEREETASPHPLPRVHPHISGALRLLFIKLQCRYMPLAVIETLECMRNGVDWPAIERICEENHAYGAVLWALNQRGQPRDALAKAEAFEKQLTQGIARAIINSDASDSNVDALVGALREIGQGGTRICLEHSSMSGTTAVPLEDIWFQLLSSQLHSVQVVSNLRLAEGADGHQLKTMVLLSLRDLVQNTFASLVTISSTRAVSFPRLFKRLVDPKLYSNSMPGTPYTEFKTILTGMLESYRSDGDMLSISQKLLHRDVFDTVEVYTKEMMRGWLAGTSVNITVSRTAIYHASCPH